MMWDFPDFQSRELGVGRSGRKKKDPLSSVRSPGCACGYSLPARIIPAFGKTAEYGTECSEQNSVISGDSQTPRAGFQLAIGSPGEESEDIFEENCFRL